MAAFLSWLKDNWFSLLQSCGIVLGLLYTAIILIRDAKDRRRSDVLALMEQHRELWSEVHRRPDLQRVLAGAADLVANPITVAEQEFLNLVIIHFHTGWQLARDETVVTLKTLKADARNFFNLPIPKSVWEQTRHTRDPKFMKFIEGCLRKGQIARKD